VREGVTRERGSDVAGVAYASPAGWLSASNPAVQTAAATLAAFLAAWLSIELVSHWGHVAPIWPTNAVGTAILLRSRLRRWPTFAAAFLLGDFLADAVMNRTFGASLGLALVNTLEALACAGGVLVLLRRRPDIRRPKDLAAFFVMAATSAAAASPLAGAVLSAGRHPAHITIALWALADALGLLIFTPALFLAGDGDLWHLARPPFVGKTLSLFAVTALAMGVAAAAPQHPVMLIGPMILVFAAIQLEFAGAAVALILVSLTTIGFVVMGLPPTIVSSFSGAAQSLWLQGYLLLCTLVTFPVAAVLAERRALEKELTASRDLAQHAMRQAEIAETISGVGHWRADYLTDRLEWSEQMYRIYGLDPAGGQPTLATTMEHCHPDDREKLAQHRVEHGEDETDTVSVRLVRPNGEIRYVIANGAVTRGANGEIVSRMGTLSDVTELKRAEAAAQESEERYRFLAEFAPDMITRTTLAGEILYVSPSSERVFGYGPDEMKVLNAQEMVHPEDFGRVMAAIFSLIETRAERLPEPLCYRARRKDGQWIWVEANPTLIFDTLTGEPHEFIDIVRDVTQTKAFETALDEARQRAEDAAAAKSAFLANMSHELRTPLTSIIGFSGLMGERPDLSPETMHFAKRISDASEALLAIINDVLDFSKLEAGQVTLEIQPLSMSRLIEETTGLVAIQAAAKGLQIRAEIDPDIPDQIQGDVARLRQVLLNFLSNAVKFTSEGSVTVMAGWRSGADETSVRIAVTDTGPGISDEGIERLFERFSQAEVSINRTHGGTGLGLAISKGIIELMGGQIGVDTKAGEGSTFWIEVPAQAAAGETAEIEAMAQPECPELRVLVVDDKPVNRELVKLMLTPTGLIIEEAAGGAEGVKAALARPFDLILMDVRMPGVDGLEATRVIRATSPFNASTPVLALTADVQPENFAACRDAGMNDIVAKPISPQELIGKILQWGVGARDGAAATGTEG
jgi:PAS domain S-box-containing protein